MREFRGVLRFTSDAERQQVLEDVKAWRNEERAAARGRFVGVARVLDKPLNARPAPRPERPLLTPGQAARSKQAGR